MDLGKRRWPRELVRFGGRVRACSFARRVILLLVRVVVRRAYIAPGYTKRTAVAGYTVFDSIEEACEAAKNGKKLPNHLSCLDDAMAPPRKKRRGEGHAGAAEAGRGSSGRAPKHDPPGAVADDDLLTKVLQYADILDPELAADVRACRISANEVMDLLAPQMQQQVERFELAGRTLCKGREPRKRKGAASAASIPMEKSRKTWAADSPP